jgi:hypothetical protein
MTYFQIFLYEIKFELGNLYPICIPKKQNPFEYCYSEGFPVPGGGIEPFLIQ